MKPIKKVFLKVPQNSLEDTCVKAFFKYSYRSLQKENIGDKAPSFSRFMLKWLTYQLLFSLKRDKPIFHSFKMATRKIENIMSGYLKAHS